MRRRTLSFVSLVALIGAGTVALPAQAVPAGPSAKGGLSISLTTPEGTTTQAAIGGFDPEATTTPGSGELELSAADEESLEAHLHEEYALFSDPIAVEAPFAVAGVTWDASDSLPAGSEVHIRMLDGGEWTDWYALDVEAAPDGVETARSGTEHAVTGSSTGVQVRITKGLGELPASLSIDIAYSDDDVARTQADPELAESLPEADSLMDSAIGSASGAAVSQSGLAAGTADALELAFQAIADSSPADSSPVDSPPAENSTDVSVGNSTNDSEQDPAGNPAEETDDKGTDNEDSEDDRSDSDLPVTYSLLSAKANIQPRSAWGANESLRTWPLTYTKFEAVVVHHTAGSNSYTKSQVPAVLGGIYYYHTRTLQWGDIGYHVVLDKFGGRWEGRYGTLATPASQIAIGGHAYGYNNGTLGVSVMGNYAEITPTETVLNSFSDVAAWKFLKAGVDPTTMSPLTVPANNMPQSTFKDKTGALFPRIIAHLDTSATTCPANIYPYMWKIRKRTYDLYDAAKSSIRFFSDVPPTHPFHADIAWMVEKNLTTGWPDGTFRPQASVTREAFIRFIYRMAGEPAPTLPKASPFKDVSPSAPYYKAIVWAKNKGLAKGYSDGTFRPQDPIRRDAVSAFLYRYAGSPAYTNTATFTDISTSEHRAAIRWMATKGISTGWPDRTFRPGNLTERGAIAAFLHRFATMK